MWGKWGQQTARKRTQTTSYNFHTSESTNCRHTIARKRLSAFSVPSNYQFWQQLLLWFAYMLMGF
jgi:hypothetical protein